VKRFAWLLLALSACEGRPRATPGPGEDESSIASANERRVIEFDLSSGVPESTGAGGLFQMPATRTYAGLVRALERGLEEETTAGVFVRMGGQTFDLAQAEEIGGLLARYSKKKLPVVCHAHGFTNATAAMAVRGCSRRWLSPAGSLDTVGIAAQQVYLKGLLDRVGIQVDFLAMGRYKSGAEPLTHDGPTEDSRRNLVETLAAIRQGWLDSVSDPALKAALEHGPWSPEEAKANGLIHELGFEAGALAEAKKLGAVDASSASFGPRADSGKGLGIGEIVRVLAGAEEATHQPHLAVVPAEGSITMDPGGPFDSGGINLRSLAKTLKRLANDESVKAVVLRIDSPGGSALASDLIWHEVTELRKKKPVITSVGGMAASGGYYIAVASQYIVAEPTSIVGSIGVFGGKIAFAPALANFGINAVTFPASPEPGAAERATYLSPLSTWDDSTRERVRAQMKSVYDLFVARVANGRKISVEAAHDSAQGRIYGAAQALERKLVDELGGLREALAVARRLGKLEEDAPVTVEGAAEGLLEMLMLGEDASEAQIAAALARLEKRNVIGLGALPERMRPFAAALAPLLQGERVVAALPYAFTVE
jgi:protease IV